MQVTNKYFRVGICNLYLTTIANRLRSGGGKKRGAVYYNNQ